MKLYTYNEIAVLLGVHPATVKRIFSKYRKVRFTRRTVRIRELDLQKFITSHTNDLKSITETQKSDKKRHSTTAQ
jgi:DNA-binding transcriptional regulator YhcF (GntR family)